MQIYPVPITEVEPNDDATTATPFHPPFAASMDASQGDVDVVALDVGPGGYMVRAFTSDLLGGPCSAGVSTQPSLVASSSGWAIAWRDTRSGVGDILFVELDADGVPLDVPTNVSNSWGRSMNPDLVLAGMVYSVIWEEEADPVGAAYRFYPFMAQVSCL